MKRTLLAALVLVGAIATASTAAESQAKSKKSVDAVFAVGCLSEEDGEWMLILGSTSHETIVLRARFRCASRKRPRGATRRATTQSGPSQRANARPRAADRQGRCASAF